MLDNGGLPRNPLRYRRDCPCIEALVAKTPLHSGGARATSKNRAVLDDIERVLGDDPDVAIYHAGLRLYTSRLCRHGLLPAFHCGSSSGLETRGPKLPDHAWANAQEIVSLIDGSPTGAEA